MATWFDGSEYGSTTVRILFDLSLPLSGHHDWNARWDPEKGDLIW